MTCGEQRLLLTRPSHQPSAEEAGVGCRGDRGVLDALQATDAHVKQVAVGGLGGRGAGVELHAGQAAPRTLVVAGRAHPFLTGAFHSQEPGAPVQQDHAGLPDQITMSKT